MTKALALALVLVSWGLPAPARAQAPAAANETEANTLVDQAATAYDQNQLDEAVRLLSRAYELSPRPSILYNRAQVLRTKDDCAGALDDYRRFLETAPPDDANRERAARKRDEMQACADERKPPPAPIAPRLEVQEVPRSAPPAGVIVSTPTTPSQPEDQAHSHRRAMRAGAWAAMGLGVLAAGAAAALAWEAHRVQQDLQSHPRSFDWPYAQSQIADGQNYATAAQLCAGLAALATGGSVTLFILSRGSTGPDNRASAAQPRAGVVGFSGTF